MSTETTGAGTTGAGTTGAGTTGAGTTGAGTTDTGKATAGDVAPVVAVAGEADLVAPERRSWRGVWLRALSLLSLVLLWFVASLFLSPNVLPGPVTVVATMIDNLGEAETYVDLGTTVYRVVAGMLIAVAAGLVIGLIMGLSKFGEEFLDSWVLVAFTVPSVVYGILAILWFGLNDVAAIVAIGVTATPAVAINMWQGVKAIDLSLIRMGRAFHFSRASILRKLVVPQVIPFLLAALRYALGLAWKIATVVELIGLSNGVGYQLGYWFGLFNMTQVLAWTLMFTIVLLFIEFAILKPTEHWLTRWRPTMQN